MKLFYSSLALLSCTSALLAADIELKDADVDKKYIITKSGTYVFKQNITGNIVINADDVTIDGKGYTLTGEIDSNRLNDGIIHGDPDKKNTTVKNVKVVIVDGGLFGVWLKGKGSKINDVIVTSPDTVGNVRGRGGLEIGPGGRISNCTITPGDDAIRLTADDTVAENCNIKMLGNGSAIQYGYNKKYEGSLQHKANKITVTGKTRKNGKFSKDTDEPNRCVVAGYWGTGEIAANVGSAQAISISVNMDSTDALCRFIVANKTMDGVTFSGSIDKASMTLGCSTATKSIPIITTRTENNGKLKTVDITIGNDWLKANYENGEKEKEYVYASDDVSGTVNGWTIANTETTIVLPNKRK